MRNVYQKKSWCTGAVQMYVDSPPINLIKIKNNAKSEKDCVKIKSHWDPKSLKTVFNGF